LSTPLFISPFLISDGHRFSRIDMSESILDGTRQPETAAMEGEASKLAGGGMFKKRAKTFSAQKGLRRPAPAPARTTTLSDDDEDDFSSDEDQGINRSDILAGRKRKRGGLIQAGTTRASASTNKGDLGVSYDINRISETSLDPRNQATAVSAEFTESELLGKPKGVTSSTTDTTNDDVYRGQKNYRQLVPQREQITTKYNPVGPQKAASNIRMTTYTDYAPGSIPLLQND
jgi:hypothetical protein